MIKCGKGCMPECEYFTTAGCVSPFNCPYKIEEHNQCTISTSGNTDFLSGIEKFFINVVKSGVLPQEPMNYDASSMKIYITYLENRIAELEDKIESGRLVELPFTVIDKQTKKEADEYKIALEEDWAKFLCYCDMDGFAITQDGNLILLDECGKYTHCPCDRFEIKAEARLKELQEGKK